MPAPVETDPFAHPDAQRRFRVLTNAEELKQALDYPWDKWAVFPHPAQAGLGERSFSGPTRVSGLAGTGKTIVALHRAVHLARVNRDATVLLATFSKARANSLRVKLASLGEPSLAARIIVKAVSAVGCDLYSERFGQRIVADVRRAMPDDGIIALDNGTYKIWFARNYRTSQPNTVLLNECFDAGGVHLIDVLMDYSENQRVLIEELGARICLI